MPLKQNATAKTYLVIRSDGFADFLHIEGGEIRIFPLDGFDQPLAVHGPESMLELEFFDANGNEVEIVRLHFEEYLPT